jgi:excisionase family DNA binding protein
MYPNHMAKLIRPIHAAEKLGVHPNTLRNLEAKGELSSIRTPGGHRRFNEQEIEELVKKSN